MIAATPRLGDQAPRARSPSGRPARCPERSFTVTGRPEPSIAARATATATSGSREQRRAGAGLEHLRHRAAHVEVDQVGPGLGGDRRGLAHHLGVGAEELHRDRALVGMDPQHLLERAPVAVCEREARDHLRDRQARAVAVRLQAHEPVADPGQRREQDAVAGPRRRRSRTGSSAAPARLRALGSLTAFSSQISRRPVSVSRSSISSIVSQNGRDRVGEPAGGDHRRLAAELGARSAARSPSISPAKPKITPDWIAARVDLPIADSGLGELDPRDPRAALGRAPSARSRPRARSRRRGTRRRRRRRRS